MWDRSPQRIHNSQSLFPPNVAGAASAEAGLPRARTVSPNKKRTNVVIIAGVLRGSRLPKEVRLGNQERLERGEDRVSEPQEGDAPRRLSQNDVQLPTAGAPRPRTRCLLVFSSLSPTGIDFRRPERETDSPGNALHREFPTPPWHSGGGGCLRPSLLPREALCRARAGRGRPHSSPHPELVVAPERGENAFSNTRLSRGLRGKHVFKPPRRPHVPPR